MVKIVVIKFRIKLQLMKNGFIERREKERETETEREREREGERGIEREFNIASERIHGFSSVTNI